MKFEVGKTYSQRFMSDYDSIAHFTVISRTAKTITFQTAQERNPVKRGLSLYDGIEQFKPFGTYSMCMVVSAIDTKEKVVCKDFGHA